MAIKKSQLYGRLWKSCNELRGSMDPSQYKNYILTLLFVKYVSDKDTLLDIPDGASFQDMVKLKGEKEIGVKINNIIDKLAEENGLKGVIDQADFNNENLLGKGKEMQDTLTKLIGIFETFDFKTNMAGGDDLLGDAYEYLMRHFSIAAGKSKGQFYTPAEVSRVLSKVIGIDEYTTPDMTVYDPTCGSGSLLLKASDEAPNGISIYGQENDQSTWALSLMNMIIHQSETAEIWKGNTLASPYFKNEDGGLKTFDFAVANPPFSVKNWTNGFDPENDVYGRFEYGMPPTKNGDYAFILHILNSLNNKGKGAVILPHGILYRGNKEAKIRKKLVNKGFIKAVIGLPKNLFYGTGIPACIIVLDKENANQRDSIFFINASKGFIKDGNKNRLREQDVHKISDYYANKTQERGYSRSVPLSEIRCELNDYNLSIARYIDSTVPEDLHDLKAHLDGGIPNFNIDSLGKYWERFPGLRSALFTDLKPGYSQIAVELNAIPNLVSSHSEVIAYRKSIKSLLEGWKDKHRNDLFNLSKSTNVKETILNLSESMLSTFVNETLINKYDAYQEVMEYWASEMQDDMYLIATDGWKVCSQFQPVEGKENHEFTIKMGKKTVKMGGKVIPASIIINHYFEVEQSELNSLRYNEEQNVRQKQEFEENFSGDEGVFSELRGKNGNIVKGSVQTRVLDLRDSILKTHDQQSNEYQQAKKIVKSKFGISAWRKGVIDSLGDFAELDLLHEWLRLYDEGARLKSIANNVEKELMVKVSEQYSKITEEKGKSLLIESKWYGSIESAINDELDSIFQGLGIRIKMIGERYSSTLSKIENKVEKFNQRVGEHLELLNEKTRLPRFSDDWKVVSLGEIGEITSSGVDKKIVDGETTVRLVNYLDVYNRSYIYSNELTHNVTAPASKATKCSVQKGDVFFTPTSEVREDIAVSAVAMEDIPDAVYSYHVVRLRIHEDWDLNFRAYVFQTKAFLDQAGVVSDGNGTRYVISLPNFRKLEVPIPKKPEQKAIGQILSDMDAEIAALEERLEKTKAIKKGMMQQLLNGRIRL